MSINKQIVLTLIFLTISIIFFSYSSIDITVADMMFIPSNHTWLLGHDTQPYKFIFYDGIKKLLIIIAVSLLFTLIFFRKKESIKSYTKSLIVVILSAILIPVIVGGLKKITNMPCPKNEIHYGGIYPRTKVWQPYPQDFNKPHIKCWPAGHASGGFALMSLFFLFKSRKNRFIALAFGVTVGWAMGLYKMLIGDHFLSHTVITMVLAWLLILIIVKFVKPNLGEEKCLKM